jgi:hypothetical protein
MPLPGVSEGFVSGARLFVASDIPLLDALVRFDLHKPEYDVHLGKLAPCPSDLALRFPISKS